MLGSSEFLFSYNVIKDENFYYLIVQTNTGANGLNPSERTSCVVTTDMWVILTCPLDWEFMVAWL